MEFRRRSSQITGLSTPQGSLGNSRKTSSFTTSRRALTTPRKWRGGESSWDNKESAEERGRSLQVPTGLSFNAATSQIQSLSTPNGAGPPYKCSNHQSSAETSSSGPHLRADKRPEEQTKIEEKLRFSSWGKRIATTTLRRSCLGPREKE